METERTLTRCGRPETASSTGMVSCFSISSGPEGRGDGVDLHLHRGGVGKGVDRQAQQRPGADSEGDDKEQNHQQAVVQREFNQTFEHK